MKYQLQKQFNKPIHKLFFAGIGGSSMSGLADMALDQGFIVEGSDMAEKASTEKLKSRGVIVHIGNTGDIPEDTDLLVYSAAIHPDNPDRVRAKALGIPEIERSDYLGLLSMIFPKTIGVAGTHGKTTTSSMMAAVLYRAQMDPSVSIGGKLKEIGDTNARLGQSDYFVIESCEYVDSFLKTQHYLGIITNIEEDHLDYFTGGLEQIKHSFHEFAAILPEDGRMICYGDSQDVLDVVKDLACPVITYGLTDANDWQAVNITYNDQGNPTFDAVCHGKKIGTFSLKIPGKHNVLNALAVIAAAQFLNIEVATVQATLADFGGAHRRFEFRGEVNGISVYEDYAHHPTELKVVIDACQNHAHKKLWVVFQAHTYSRTYYLLNEFVDAFQGTDELIISEIFSDREDNHWDIYPEDMAKRIKAKHHIPTVVLQDFDRIVKYLTDNMQSGDLVLVAGSQSINQVAYMLVDELKRKYE